MAQVAKVTALTGKAFVVGADGSIRLLKVGDAIEKGELVRTAAGATVELTMQDGQKAVIAAEQNVRVDDNMTQGEERPAAQESAVANGTIDSVIQVLGRDGDPTEELEAAAAGGSAGGGGDGSDFVRLLRVIETVDPLAYEYSFESQAIPDEILPSVDAPAEPVVGSVTLRYVLLGEDGQPVTGQNGGFVYIDGQDVVEGTRVGIVAEVDVAPTGSSLVLTLSNGTTITIPAGETSGFVELEVRADEAYVQGDELIDVSVTGVSGGQYDDLETDQSTSITVVDDKDPTTVSLSVSDVTEDDASVTFTATLSHAGETDVTIKTTQGDILIKAGETTGKLMINTQDSDVHLDPSSVSVTVKSVSGGNFEAVDFSDATATAQISDTIDTTTAALTSAGKGNEDAGSVTYTVTLNNTGEADQEFQITLSNGQVVPITIAAGELVGEVTVAWGVEIPPDAVALEGYPDSDVFAEENFELSAEIVAVGNGGNFEQLVVENNSEQVSIGDSVDTVTLTVIAVDAEGHAVDVSQVAEGETAHYKVVAMVNGVVDSSITGNVDVVFANNGNTTSADYTPSTTSVAIGEVFNAAAVDDAVADNGETFTVTLKGGSFDQAGKYEDVAYTGSVTTTIEDADQVPVASNVTGSGQEDSTGIQVTLQGSDGDGSVTGFIIGDLSSLDGTLYLNGEEVDAGDTVAANVNGEVVLTFVPTPDLSGSTPTATFTFDYRAVDNGGNQSDVATALITVAPVTDTPDVQLSVTPVTVIQTSTLDVSNSGDPEGFTVTAYSHNGDVGEVYVFGRQGDAVSGLGVVGEVAGNDSHRGVEISGNEKLVVDLDTPAVSVTYQLSFLRGSDKQGGEGRMEHASITVRYTDGTFDTRIISGDETRMSVNGVLVSDRVSPVFTAIAPEGKTIASIELQAGDNVNDDVLLHSVSYGHADTHFIVDVKATPVDVDHSEKITKLTLTTNEGVEISGAEFRGTVSGTSVWELPLTEAGGNAGVTVSVDPITGEVTVSGLNLTVPEGLRELFVTATAEAVDGTAVTALGSDSVTSVIGSAGYDILTGTVDDDILIGGTGNDTLIGGSGADVFKWSLGDEGTAGSPAVDHIADFSKSEGDTLDLRDLLQEETEATLSQYLSFGEEGGKAVLNISATANGDVTQKVVFDNQSLLQLEQAFGAASADDLIAKMKSAGNLDTH